MGAISGRDANHSHLQHVLMPMSLRPLHCCDTIALQDGNYRNSIFMYGDLVSEQRTVRYM